MKLAALLKKKNEKEKRKRKYALHLPFGRRIDDGRKMYSSPPEISNKMNFDDQKKGRRNHTAAAAAADLPAEESKR